MISSFNPEEGICWIFATPARTAMTRPACTSRRPLGRKHSRCRPFSCLFLNSTVQKGEPRMTDQLIETESLMMTSITVMRRIPTRRQWLTASSEPPLSTSTSGCLTARCPNALSPCSRGAAPMATLPRRALSLPPPIRRTAFCPSNLNCDRTRKSFKTRSGGHGCPPESATGLSVFARIAFTSICLIL
jgi:hypothetical protein